MAGKSSRPTFKGVSTATLRQLREGIAAGVLPTPVDKAALVGFGVRHRLAQVEASLSGHRSAACLAMIDVVLAEREDKRKTPELVWTGPEQPGGAARDTAVVLRELFEQARESVVLGGYAFDHASAILAPLHAAMRDHGVVASFFVHVDQIEKGQVKEDHLKRCLGRFLKESWPFGDPKPRIYYDKRALIPGPPYASMHAKCVVVDGTRAFISSANFTTRAQERNIEVGVLIDDASFAGFLAGQWLGLIDAGAVGEYG